MFRRSFQTAAIVLFTGALSPLLPVAADPAAFINNVGSHLQAATKAATPEQKLAGFQELFRADFDVPGLGRFVLGVTVD
jgi:hypothetical protein